MHVSYILLETILLEVSINFLIVDSLIATPKIVSLLGPPNHLKYQHFSAFSAHDILQTMTGLYE